MRSAAWISFSLVIATAIGIAGLLARCGEERESYYDTRVAVVRDGAIPRGWIPDFLPESATKIREFHDLDSNETWLQFSAEFDQSFVANRCNAVGQSDLKKPRRSPGAWWPSELVDVEMSALNSFEFYVCDGHDALAVDRRTATFYHWKLSS